MTTATDDRAMRPLPRAVPLWRRRLHHPPILVTLVFVLAGAVWIVLTDALLYAFVRDPQLVARFETAKGWLFVAAAALVIFATTSYAFVQLLRSQATLRAILDSIADGVLLVGGRERAVVDANPAALQILGVSKAEVVGLDGERFSRRFHIVDRDGRIVAGDRYAAQRALAGEVVASYRATIHPPAGPPVEIDVTAAPVRARRHGPIDLAVAVMHDVSREVDIEDARNELYAAAAHALKTPLATIKVRAQTMQAIASTDAMRAAADSVDRQVVRIQRTLDNIFILARIRRGDIRYHMGQIDLASVLERAVAAERAGDRIASVVETRPEAFGDGERLAIAIGNMLHAALWRTPADVGSVSVRLVDGERGGRIVVRAPSIIDREGDSYDDEIKIGLQVAQEVIASHDGRCAIGRFEPSSEWVAWFELPAPTRSDSR